MATDLREVIKAWRDHANRVDLPTPVSSAYSACANQLDLALAARPAQAGEVAMPDPVAKRSTTEDGKVLCEPVYTADQLRAYGDARAAAAVAQAGVPEEMTMDRVPWAHDSARHSYSCGWNACRDAMLSAAPQPTKGNDDV